MSKSVKVIVLLLVLILPALIFIFLFSFGENKFNVQVQHPEGLKIEGCEPGTVPHKIPPVDSLHLNKSIYQLIFVADEGITKLQFNELERVSGNHPELQLLIITTDAENISRAEDYSRDNWQIFTVKNENLEELNRCGFGNIDDQPLILRDPERHIRGYYDINQKEELDRLEGEIKILME